jgi:circadian clock protein KaiC
MEFVYMKKVPTGLEGLDDMLGGGLPSGRCTLVCGGPGSGKTTFCIQFLYNGITECGEAGLYVSLGESPVHLRENMAGFGWDIERLEKEGKLKVIDASPTQPILGEGARIRTDVKIGAFSLGAQDFSVDGLIQLMKDTVEQNQVKRVALDPITTLMLQYPDVVERQIAVLNLMGALTKFGVTSLMTTELRESSLRRQAMAEEFLSHGVIIFNAITRNGRTIEAVQIKKMRGIAHDRELRPYRIEKNGVEIFSKEKIIIKTKN